MKQIKTLIEPYKSRSEAAKHMGVHLNQLNRWLSCDAMVNDTGDVWIKTSKKPLVNLKIK